MAKQGMRRFSETQVKENESKHKIQRNKNDAPLVPEIQGKAKTTKEKAGPI